MENLLDQAFEHASEYGSYVSDYEYHELMRIAQYDIPESQKARNAFANAKYRITNQNWDPFKYVRSRDTGREDFYASIGTNTIDSGGCFITSACMAHMQEVFDDECYELKTLRDYRDGYLKEHHPKDIEIYYATAPQIVARIDSLEDCDQIYRNIYVNMILPSVSAIERRDYEEAYRIYAEGCMRLKEVYGG